MEETGIIRQLHKMGEQNGKVLRDGADGVKVQLAAMIGRLSVSSLRRIYVLGCGTSYFGALNVKLPFELFTGIPTEGAEAFAFAAYQNMDLIDQSTLVLGFSTSGETDAVADAFAKCRGKKAKTVAIAAVAQSTVGRLADEVLLTGAVDETNMPRTKAQSQGLIAMYLMAIAMGRASGYLPAARVDAYAAEVNRCIDAVADVIQRVEPTIQALAKKYAGCTAALVLGSGYNTGTAQTGALMITEMAKVHSWGDELENFLHGRFREVNQTEPLLILAPDGAASGRTLDFLTVTHHVRGPTIVFTDRPTEGMKKLATHIVELKGGVSEVMTPIVFMTALHLYGYYIALANGQDPNKRRYPDIVPTKARYQPD